MRFQRAAIFSIIVSATLTAAHAAEEWLTNLATGQKLLKSQNYGEAEKLLELSLRTAPTANPESPKLLDLYDSLAEAYCYTGKQKQATEYLEKTLAAREKSTKRNDLMLYKSVVMLATIYEKQDRFDDAEKLYVRGLKMFEGKGPVKVLLQSLAQFALGQLYLDRGKPDEAIKRFEEALALRKSSFLKGAMPVESLYTGLGMANAMLKKYEVADSNFKLALKEFDKKKKDSRGYALLEANYATSVLSNVGKYDEARKYLEDAKSILEKTEGAEGQNMATCYANLASVAISQDRYDEAEQLIRKAIALHEKQLGPEHSDVATDLNTLTMVYRNQGKYDDAAASAERAVTIYKKQLGAESMYTAGGLTTLAEIYADQGKLDAADKIAEEVLAIYSKHSGADKNKFVPVLVLRARIAVQNQNYPLAEQVLKQACEIQEENIGNADPSYMARVYSDLAFLYDRTNRLPDAEAVLKKSIALKEKIYNSKHASLLSDLSLLNKIYSLQNRKSDTTNVEKHIEAIKQEHPELKPPTLSLSSATTLVNPTAPASSARPVKDKWALVVGISNFKDPSINLRFAAKDAVDFARFLTEKEGFAPDHVRLLTDKQATREGIIKALGGDWLGRLALPDDLVVIYISSHGSVSREESGGFNFLVAHDTDPDALLSTGLPMQWLSAIIKEQVHSSRIVTILDVCHSGVATGQKGITRETAFDFSKLQIGEGQAMLCSSAPEQVSWESRSYPNSVFTRQLIDALAAPDIDLNKAFESLSDRVQSEVLRDRGKLQTPLLFSKSWQGAPPVLSIKPSSPRKP